MTTRTNARIAGLAFLVYIAAAFPAMVLHSRAVGSGTTAAKLASIAQHVPEMRLAILLDLVGCFCALILAVTLYAITRDVDPDLALMVLAFRTGEGVIGALSLPQAIDQIWLATVSGPSAPDPTTANALAAMLLKLPSGGMMIGASFFAVGSLCFSYLLLRGRLIPVVLSWIGVIGSVLVVVLLPLQLAGFVSGPITQWMWLPLLAFEVPLGFWLIIKGVAAPARRQAAQ